MSMINDVINIIRMKVIDSRIRFVVKIDSKIPSALIGDEIRIRQVLLNVLGNAVKYTERGYVSLTVTGETEFGEVIPDKNLNVLAMPVHSVSIANILNGASENFSYSENNEALVSFTAADANILIVDDISTNLVVAKGLLAPYKVQVELCKSGMLAIDAVKTNRYDMIFMDHKMPVMDGIETTLRIRAMGNDDPYYKNVPIIALTANAVSGTKEMFMENGFNDFLSKPIDTVKLNSVLEKWIPREKQKKQTI